MILSVPWFQNEYRVLWKLGTLPPGLITFYGLTQPLEKSWHVLGLGYNPSVDRSEIEKAAVIHYNGNMKPWLELAMRKYRAYWTKYIKFDHSYLRRCKFSEWVSWYSSDEVQQKLSLLLAYFVGCYSAQDRHLAGLEVFLTSLNPLFFILLQNSNLLIYMVAFLGNQATSIPVATVSWIWLSSYTSSQWWK